MHDYMSTLFSAVQKETHQGVIGKEEFDRRTYSVRYGDDQPPRPYSRRRAVPVVAVRVVLALIALLALIAVLT